MLNLIFTVVWLLTLALAVWAFVDCLMRPPAAFGAVGRQSKPAWLIFLGLSAAVLFFFSTISLLGLAAVIISVFYLVDVRVKISAVTRR